MKRNEKFIIIISIVLTIVLLIGMYSLYSSQRFDYLRSEEIPKGYTEYDGESYAGKDYSHRYWYKYNEKPKLCDCYNKVGNNTELIEMAIEDSNVNGLKFDISEDDYFILKSYNNEGKEINEYNSKYSNLMYYNVQSNTLYDIMWIW